MKPLKGYYSLIQYCPDLSRLEAANVGVILFCPEAHFIRARTTNFCAAYSNFFGSAERDWDQIREAKTAIEDGLKSKASAFAVSKISSSLLRLGPMRFSSRRRAR